MTDSYLTVRNPADVEIEVKKSRFLARIRRVCSEDAARELIDQTRKEYWDARHHCSAFIIGAKSPIARSSDDGEPAGTAGMPMLQTLRRHRLSDVLAVVTRYFGGTLLGTGGLVRAYSDATRAGLRAAGELRRVRRQRATIVAGSRYAGKIDHTLRSRGTTILRTEYGADVAWTIGVDVAELRQLSVLLEGISDGGALVTAAGDVWLDETPVGR